MTQEDKEQQQSREPIPACERLLAEAGSSTLSLLRPSPMDAVWPRERVPWYTE
jgi:hypothetical protein